MNTKPMCVRSDDSATCVGLLVVQACLAHQVGQKVSEFIRSLPGCEEHGKVFKDEQIDGEAFLLMTQADIVKIMSIKLGPALKIFNSILMFKAAEKNSHNEL
ncbi:UNVERIFIED_CONTAM: Lethal(3)malignant brain tumor-like protein 3 [Gekko kuhli]